MGTAAWNQGWSWEAAHPGGGATHKMGAEDGFWMDGWCWRSGPSLICSTEPRPDGAGGAQPTEQLDQPAQPTLLGRRPLDQSRPRGTKPAHPTRLDRAGLIHQPPDQTGQPKEFQPRRDETDDTRRTREKTKRDEKMTRDKMGDTSEESEKRAAAFLGVAGVGYCVQGIGAWRIGGIRPQDRIVASDRVFVCMYVQPSPCRGLVVSVSVSGTGAGRGGGGG